MISVFLLFLIFLISTPSLAADKVFFAEIVRPKSSEQIREMKFNQEHIPIRKRSTWWKEEIYVHVDGAYTKKDWNLICGETWLVESTDDKKTFSQEVILRGPSTPITFVEVDGMGNVKEETLIIRFIQYEEFKTTKAQSGASAKHFVGVGLGPTLLTYSQTNFTDYTATLVTVKASYRYKILPPNLDLGTNVFYNAFTIGSSNDSTSAHFLGFNLRGGYRFPFEETPWTLQLMGGIYYNTMSVTSKSFGFQNLAGPQLYPTISRSMGKGNFAFAYLKFSPVASNFKVRSLSSREMALGGGWTFLYKGKRISTSLHYADLQIKILHYVGRSKTISLDLAYEFPVDSTED